MNSMFEDILNALPNSTNDSHNDIDDLHQYRLNNRQHLEQDLNEQELKVEIDRLQKEIAEIKEILELLEQQIRANKE